jgi:hypothetical protein
LRETGNIGAAVTRIYPGTLSLKKRRLVGCLAERGLEIAPHLIIKMTELRVITHEMLNFGFGATAIEACGVRPTGV